MADHILTLNLTDEALERLKAAAREAGMSPQDYAKAILTDASAEWTSKSPANVREDAAPFDAHPDGTPPDHDWAEADRRLAEYDRTGKCVTLDDAMQQFEQTIESKLAARR